MTKFTRKVLDAKERGSLSIPISDLIDSAGGLIIHPELVKKNLVEVRQSKGELHLRIGGLVGRVPLTENISIDIAPKFPISNLNRMVDISHRELGSSFPIFRPYARIESADIMPVPLIKDFIHAVLECNHNGIERGYTHRRSECSPRPKIDFNKTAQFFWSKGVLNLAVVEEFLFSSDIEINQLIKLASMKAIALCKSDQSLEELVAPLSEVIMQLRFIDERKIDFNSVDVNRMLNGIGRHRKEYFNAVRLGLEILRNTELSLSISKSGIDLTSYILYLDDIFERYIRNALRETLKDFGHSLHVLDGNLKGVQKTLFDDNKSFRIKPDLVFKESDGQLKIIGDVKYKGRPQETDRYQIITHALSYGVTKAILIYPSNSSSKVGLFRLGIIGGIDVYEYYFELNENLSDQEKSLAESVSLLML